MALIELHGVSTVFGAHPLAALQRLRQQGLDKAQLLARHQHVLALDGVSLQVAAGELFVIMGLSGSGKSTLLRHLNGLVAPTEGRLLLDGRDTSQLGAAAWVALRRQHLAMVFQDFGLLPHRSLLDNVALPLELRGLPPAQRRAQARPWLDLVGLGDVANQRPDQLSGGMRQRVGLARALCAQTGIILMDEPFSALDPLTRSQLQDELLKLQQQTAKTIVVVTHDLDEALRLGDRIAILHEGQLVQTGTPADILSRPANAHVAAFTAGINRARAWRIRSATVPWPEGQPTPPWKEAMDEEAPLEQVLVHLLGREAPLAVRRAHSVVGQVSVDKVRQLLAR